MAAAVKAGRGVGGLSRASPKRPPSDSSAVTASRRTRWIPPSCRSSARGASTSTSPTPACGHRSASQDTGTNIYSVVDGGIKTETFLFYPPKRNDYKTVFGDDAREYWFKLDGKNIYKDPQGPNGLGQTVGMWLVDRNTLYRERMTKGVVDERVMYRVSPDGQTLVWTNFNADGASGHVVWDRIKLTPTHGPAH